MQISFADNRTNFVSVANTSTLADHSLLPPSRLTLILMMGGAFCCPMSVWTLFKGYLSYSDAFFLLALLTHVGRMVAHPRVISISLPLVAYAIILCISALITATIDGPHGDPSNATKLFFSMILLPVLIALIVGVDNVSIDRFLVAWLAGAAFSALIALASSYQISLFGLYDKLSATGRRAAGLSYHPNAFGYTCSLLIPVVVYFWGRTSNLIHRILLAVPLLLLLYALTASGSRGSLIGLIFGMIPFAVNASRRQRPFVLLFLLGAAFAALSLIMLMIIFDLDIPANLKESAISRLLGLTTSASGADVGRLSYINLSLKLFNESPVFGAGYWWLRGAHMHILGIMASGGLFGLWGFVFWMAAIFFAVRRVAKAQAVMPHQEGSRALWTLVLSGLIVWFVGGAFQPALIDRNGYLLLGILFAFDMRTTQQLKGRFNRQIVLTDSAIGRHWRNV